MSLNSRGSNFCVYSIDTGFLTHYNLCSINGKAIGWGAEAPRDKIRVEVEKTKQQTVPGG